MKKLLALILSISMLIMCAPGLSLVASAAVEFDGGLGTSVSPYLISKAEQFMDVFNVSGSQRDLALNKNIYFKQTADIELDSFQNFGNDSAYNVKCNYDGDGHSITIKSYVNDGTTYGGLFGRFGGELKNLTMKKGATITGNSYVGAFAGFVNSGKFINCVNKTDVSGSAHTGGIAGTLQNGIAINCINEGDVSGTSSTGGIAGYLYGTSGTFINYCINYGNITGNSAKVGGIAGLMSTKDKPCIATIENSINAGTVTTQAEDGITGAILGGIAAGLPMTSAGDPSSFTVNDCFNVGELTNGGGLVVGACGEPASEDALEISVNNFYDISNPEVPLYVVDAEPYITCTGTGLVLTANGVTPETIINAYATNEKYEVGADEGYEYPNFVIANRTFTINTKNYEIDSNIAYDSAIGGPHMKPSPDGSEFYPYLIATPEDFIKYFGEDGAENDKLLGGNFFKQTADIVLSDYTPANATFDGIYDGNSKKITIEKYTPCGEIADEIGQGLVSNLTGTIKNLTVAGKIGDGIKKYVSGGIGSTGYKNVAGFAGKSTDGIIINCVNEAEITGTSSVGGFVGTGVRVRIENSVNKGNVIGRNSYIAGFIGYITSGPTNIVNCGNYGIIRNLHTGGRYHSAGFVGQTAGVINISKSFNAGDCTVVSHSTKAYGAGSFIGTMGSANSTINITDCFNTGKIAAYTSAGADAAIYADNYVIISYYTAPANNRSHTYNITNFYDIADQGVSLVPETFAERVTANITNIVDADGDIATAFAGNAAFEVVEGYAYPNFKLTEDVTVKYDPALRVSVVDLAFTEETPIFLSSEDTVTEVKTSDTNEVITTSYAVVNGKFAGVTSLNGVRYGVLITKDRSKSGTKLTNETATEIAYADRNITASGVATYGMLIYGENMVPGDTYYVRPFVECAGLYSYGTATSFVLPVKAE